MAGMEIHYTAAFKWQQLMDGTLFDPVHSHPSSRTLSLSLADASGCDGRGPSLTQR